MATDPRYRSSMARSEVRERIIEAARREFYTRGFENTSLADLAVASGVPKGNFYHHFKTKDEVLHGVLEARAANVRASLDRWESEIPGPEARLRRLVDMLSREHEELVQYGCPMGSLLTELGKHRADLRAAALVPMDAFVEFAGEQLRALGYARRPARQLAQRLLARLQGAVLLAHAYEDRALLRREVADILAWLQGLADEDASS
jgi:AcrR family transcriptional regulator